MSTPPVVELKPYQARGLAEQAWFEDDQNGYHAEIELNGQKFQVREVSTALINKFSSKERVLTKRLQTLGKEQLAAEAAAADEGLSNEQLDNFAAQSNELLTQQFANSDELIIAALVGWSLPRELNADNVRKLSKTARRKLAELIAQRSTLGADEQSFLAKPSRK